MSLAERCDNAISDSKFPSPFQVPLLLTIIKMSYRSALMTNITHKLNAKAEEFVPEHIKNPQPTFWNTEGQEEPEFFEHKGEKFENPAHALYKKFVALRANPIFQKKFAIFAENMLCITNSDVIKGLRFAHPSWMGTNYTDKKGQKRKYVGFYLEYNQDDLMYRVAYECDDIDDPQTGWFMQWFCKDDCCGCSCDYYGCYSNYKTPKGYIKGPVERRKNIDALMK